MTDAPSQASESGRLHAAPNRQFIRSGLVLPVLAPLVVTAGITVLFSHRMAQKTTSLQAQRIHQEMFLRVDAYLSDYFSVPVEALQLTQAAVESGQIETDNLAALDQHFWIQSQVFDQLSEIYWGSREAESSGVVRRDDGSRELVSSGNQPGTRSLFRLDAQGQRNQLLQQYSYDPRLRPWYQLAATAQQPQWTEVYRWSNRPILGITLAQPSYDAQSQLQGVFAIDLNLSTIQQFLQQLSIVLGDRKVFIVDRSGSLIASSTDQAPFQVTEDSVERLAPENADDPIIRGISEQLKREFGSIEAIQQKQILQYEIDESVQLLRISPWRDSWGIDWLVVMSVPEAEIVGDTRQNNRRIALLNGAAILLAASLSLLLGRWIIQQIKGRTDRIQSQKEQLRSRTEALESTLSTLQDTQEKLIEASTMGALGRLVSGIAHEVNTPLGNAILAASTLDSEIQYLEEYLKNAEQMEGDRAQASELPDYLEMIQNCNTLISQNIQKAGQLVEGFKLVAVEQPSLQRRVINLKSYINGVLQKLSSQIGPVPHQITVLGTDDLEIETEPVAIYQIITHLVINSINHAYATDESGAIEIRIEAQHDRVLLHYQDDGKGIDPAIRRKIFMPFFTTDSPAQSSGLGLNLVYNLVTRRLRGEISIESNAGKGTTFLISFPQNLIETQDAIA